MMSLLFFSLIESSQARVIRLEDLVIESKIVGPEVVELEASQLQKKVEAVALRQLIRLEKRLTSPASGTPKSQPAAQKP